MDVGGQAVIEGVMMRSPNNVYISVRKEDGTIIGKGEALRKKSKIWKWPLLRGIWNLIEMLIIGFKALSWSANQAAGEDEEDFSWKELLYVLVVSVGFAVLFFIAAPLYLTKLVVASNGIIFNLIDGLFRIVIFIVYIMVISIMKDVRRVFEYHGAEHKVVNCYEAGLKLTPENIKKNTTTIHPRCGTAFLAIVLIVSILLFSLIVSDNFWVKFGTRILLIPVVAAVSYELLKLSAKYHHNWFFKSLISPGLLIQKITTKEPDDNQIEVALYAFNKVIKMENE